MGSVATALFETLGLHSLALPHLGVKPGEVRIFKGGRPFAGRFELDDVFDGDFSGVVTGPDSSMPNFSRALANEQSASLEGGMKGPLGLLAGAEGTLSAQGAKRMRLAGFEGHLSEMKPGPLHAALEAAAIRKPGPLGRGDVAVVIVGVASLKVLSIALETELGGRVQLDAAAQAALTASVGAAATRISTGEATFTYDEPMPFAVQLWTVKWPLLGSTPHIRPATGPMGLLGDGDGVDYEFGEDVGSHDLVIDL